MSQRSNKLKEGNIWLPLKLLGLKVVDTGRNEKAEPDQFRHLLHSPRHSPPNFSISFREIILNNSLVPAENTVSNSLDVISVTQLSSCPLVLSGYDFGYLVKLLTDARLPEEEHDFFQILNLFFPAIYDVKYLMKSCKNLKVNLDNWVTTSELVLRLDLKLLMASLLNRRHLSDQIRMSFDRYLTVVCLQGGLQEVADQLELKRIGRQHQAGSDSLLTGMAFFRMKEVRSHRYRFDLW